MPRRPSLALAYGLILLAVPATASNLRISNVGLEIVRGTTQHPDGSVEQLVDVFANFDVSWGDSWREDPAIANGKNWDAVWLFLKARTTARGKKVAEVPQEGDLDVYELSSGVIPPTILARLPAARSADEDTEIEVLTVDPEGLWGITFMDEDEEEDLTTYSVELRDRIFYVYENRPGGWDHPQLAPEGHMMPEGMTFDQPSDRLGIFLYRAEQGDRGTVAFKDVRLKVDTTHIRDILTAAPTEIDVHLHGVEMVYVPSGRFKVGQHGCDTPRAPSGCFFDSKDNSEPYEVKSEDAITICPEDKEAEGLCYLVNGRPRTIRDQVIGEAFPKGFAAFYAMKYELTQGQYADFVNLQTDPGRLRRFAHGAQSTYRYATIWDRQGRGRKRVALRPERANNWVNWADAAAYLDWAALRPMTELEYEKMSRGPNEPIANEFAWGTARVYAATLIIGSEEDQITVNGNCNIGEKFFVGGDGGFGPLPGHAFAPSTSKYLDAVVSPAEGRFAGTGEALPVNHREREGRSYFGLMQLSGNLWEFAVSVGVSAGQQFKGENGDGMLDDDGEANHSGWPKGDGFGIGFRGGAWYTDDIFGRVADRFYSGRVYPYRSHDSGIRGVRTAPRRDSQ